jgi:hypothetical protein
MANLEVVQRVRALMEKVFDESIAESHWILEVLRIINSIGNIISSESGY